MTPRRQVFWLVMLGACGGGQDSGPKGPPSHTTDDTVELSEQAFCTGTPAPCAALEGAQECAAQGCALANCQGGWVDCWESTGSGGNLSLCMALSPRCVVVDALGSGFKVCQASPGYGSGFSCSGITSEDACVGANCTWTGDAACAGTPRSCESLDPASCDTVQGCRAGTQTQGLCGLRCTCPDGTEKCDDLCVDTSSSILNCGACGNHCDLGTTCIEGNCVACDEDDSSCGTPPVVPEDDAGMGPSTPLTELPFDPYNIREALRDLPDWGDDVVVSEHCSFHADAGTISCPGVVHFRTVLQPGQPAPYDQISVFIMKSLTVEEGGFVSTNGDDKQSHPVAIVALEGIVIRGSVSASRPIQPVDPHEPGAGGRGGRYCGVYDTPTPSPFVGGAAGEDALGGSEGGGALQLVAGTHIELATTGRILNRGANGYLCVFDPFAGGGGSGGTILLEAPSLRLDGQLAATGGKGGHCDQDPAFAGQDGGDGRIYLHSRTGSAEIGGEALVLPDLTRSCATQGALLPKTP